MSEDKKQPTEAMQKDWSMREIKETRYQQLLEKEKRLEAIELGNKVILSHSDFIKLLTGYEGFIEFAPKSNFDGSEQNFCERMEDFAIGNGSYQKANKLVGGNDE